MTPIEIHIITEEMRKTIADVYGKMQAAHIHMEDGSVSFAAMLQDQLVGFISAYPKVLNDSLALTDAYIDIIEVHPEHRQQGIACALIQACEEWAKAKGHRQVRAWSSEDKTEAIVMWHRLGYAMCPAELMVNQGQLIVRGYYVAKVV